MTATPGTALEQAAASPTREARVCALAPLSLASDDPAEIVQAVREMSSVYTPASLQDLTTLVWGTASRWVREEAVTALLVLGKTTGDPDRVIRDALRSLNAGVDTEVAERAGYCRETSFPRLAGAVPQDSSATMRTHDQYAAECSTVVLAGINPQFWRHAA